MSENNIEESVASQTVTEIVAGTQITNTELDLTGALLFTDKYYAMILEGPTESIKEPMVSLNDDRRHGRISIIDKCSIAERKFSDWKMDYDGPSQFVSRHVSRLLYFPAR